MYKLELTDRDIETIYFAGYRYGWSDTLIKMGLEVGENKFEEHQIWAWKDGVDGDMEGGHDGFPLLDPRCDLCAKLAKLYQSIV